MQADQFDVPTRVRDDRAAFSIPSIISMVAVVLAFATSPGAALFWSILAVITGVLGVAMAVLPSKRGGVWSMVAIGLGLIGIIGAVIRIIL